MMGATVVSSLLFLLCVGFGTHLSHLHSRIVNGVPVTASAYPYIVDIRSYHPEYETVEFNFCAGSLIRLEHPVTILTAAHCLFNTTDLAVFLLRSDQDAHLSSQNNFTFHIVWKYILHQRYNNAEIDNDIALVFLDEDLSSNRRLSTVTVSNPDPCCINDEPLQVIGYGSDYEGGEATDTLEYTDKKFVLRDECEMVLNDYFITKHNISAYSPYFDPSSPKYTRSISDNMICAIGNNTDACQGDSGGPLIKTGTNIQVGIVSWGNGCNIIDIPAVYTDVGLYTSWIDVQIESVINTFITTSTELQPKEYEYESTHVDQNTASCQNALPLASVSCILLCCLFS